MKLEKDLQLVSLEQAKKLKELGFDWEVNHNYNTFEDCNELCNGYKNNYNIGKRFNISAPSVAIALKWFRDVKVILSDVVCCYEDKTYCFSF